MQPGGQMSTTGRRRCRRQRGLHNWRLVRYADDFVVLVTGPRADVEALHEQIAVVLATMGLRMSQTKTQVVNMSEGSTTSASASCGNARGGHAGGTSIPSSATGRSDR